MWLTTKEIMERFGISRPAVYKMAKREKWETKIVITGKGQGGKTKYYKIPQSNQSNQSHQSNQSNQSNQEAVTLFQRSKDNTIPKVKDHSEGELSIIMEDAEWHNFKCDISKIRTTENAHKHGMCKNCKLQSIPHPQDNNSEKYCTIDFIKIVPGVEYKSSNVLGLSYKKAVTLFQHSQNKTIPKVKDHSEGGNNNKKDNVSHDIEPVSVLPPQVPDVFSSHPLHTTPEPTPPTITGSGAISKMETVQNNRIENASHDDRQYAFSWEKIIIEYEKEAEIAKKKGLSITKELDPRFQNMILSGEILQKEYHIIKKFSIKTLRRKLKEYQKAGRDVSVLLPKRKNSGRKKKNITEIYQSFRILAAHPNRIDLRKIYEKLKEQYPDMPSYSTMRRYYLEKVKNDHLLRGHFSGKEYKRNHSKLHITRKMDIFPGDLWQSDGHTLNFLVKSPFYEAKDITMRKLIRPVLMPWLDVATGMITGYACSYSESFGLMVSSFRDAVEKWGVPKQVMFDNGSAFLNVLTDPYWFAMRKGKHLTKKKIQAIGLINRGYPGFFQNIGVQKVTFVTPGNPEGKKIEPGFHNIFAFFEKSQFTYLGESTEKRPEHMRKTNLKILHDYGDKIMTWEEFLIVLDEYIKEYNNKKKQSLEGYSPKEIYEDFGPYQKLSELELNAKLVAIERRKIGQNGIIINGLRYFHPLFSLHYGEEIEVHYDVRNLRYVRIANLDGSLWPKPAEMVTPGSYTDKELSLEAIKHRARLEKETKKVYAKAMNRGADVRKLSYQEEAEILEETTLEEVLAIQAQKQKKIKHNANVDDYILALQEEKEKGERKKENGKWKKENTQDEADILADAEALGI